MLFNFKLLFRVINNSLNDKLFSLKSRVIFVMDIFLSGAYYEIKIDEENNH